MNLVFQCLFCYTRVSTNTEHITVFSVAVYFLVFHIPLLIAFHEIDVVDRQFLDWFLTCELGYRLPVWEGLRLFCPPSSWPRERSSFFPARRSERKSESVQINGKNEERWGRREEIIFFTWASAIVPRPSHAEWRALDPRDSKEK